MREIDVLSPPIKYSGRRSFYRRRIFFARHNSSINRVAGRWELFYRPHPHFPLFSSQEFPFIPRKWRRILRETRLRTRNTEQEGKRERERKKKEKELPDILWRTTAMNFTVVVKMGARIRKKKWATKEEGGERAGKGHQGPASRAAI